MNHGTCFPTSSQGMDADSARSQGLRLASLGLRVLPVQPRSKVPAIVRWTEKATGDPRTIRRWFPHGSDRNLGLRTGDSVVVLDIDPRNGGEESFGAMARAHGHPPLTATSLTGGGGYGLIYRVAEPVPSVPSLFPGIDVKADGGMVVVAPSIHPGTGHPYLWQRHPSQGIARLAGWWLRQLTRPAMHSEGRTVRLGRLADPERLAEWMIEWFPVTGPGERHAQMNRAIGHLAGQQYAEDLIVAVMATWTDHFHGRGLCRTDTARGIREVEANLRSTLRNRKFTVAVSARDHRAECKAIELTEGMRETIRSGTVAPDTDGKRTLRRSRTTANCKRVTQSDGIGTRLCQSKSEAAFVEAVLVHVLHKIENGEFPRENVVRMTDGQWREIMATRHPGTDPGHPQKVQRLKSKYFGRPRDGKPATRFELMEEVAKGTKEDRKSAGPGTPSEYRLTGLRRLLDTPE